MAQPQQHEDEYTHVVPAALYVGIWAALMVGTLITVLASMAELGPFNIVVALLIATIKGTLVVLFVVSWPLALAACATLPIFLLPARRVGQWRRQLVAETRVPIRRNPCDCSYRWSHRVTPVRSTRRPPYWPITPLPFRSCRKLSSSATNPGVFPGTPLNGCASAATRQCGRPSSRATGDSTGGHVSP